MAKFLQETETLDTNGEYSKITKTFTTKSEEPAFIKLYVEHMLSFKNLSKTLNPILLEFLKYMSYATDKQLIYLNAAMKREIAKKTNKSFKRVEQALTEFVKSEIFKRIAVATYQVNPFLFGKGDWKDIKNIRATYNYAENRIEQVEVETFEKKEIGIITKTKNEEILIQSFKNELKKTEPHPDLIPLIENEKSCPHCDEKLKLKKDKSEYYCPNFFSKDEQKKCKGHTEKNEN